MLSFIKGQPGVKILACLVIWRVKIDKVILARFYKGKVIGIDADVLQQDAAVFEPLARPCGFIDFGRKGDIQAAVLVNAANSLKGIAVEVQKPGGDNVWVIAAVYASNLIVILS